MNIAIVTLIPFEEPLWYDEFVKPIEKILKKNNVDFTTYPYQDFDKLNKNQFDKIILSGAPIGEFEYDLNLLKWIKTYENPILGICAGMQIIGKIYNCEEKEKLEIGLTNVEVEKQNNLFNEDFQAYQLHSKNIIPNDNFEILAKDSSGVQSIKHINKPHYGVIFHPEVRNQDIILNFLKIENE